MINITGPLIFYCLYQDSTSFHVPKIILSQTYTFSPQKCDHKYYEQKYLSVIDQFDAKFNRRWELWKNLLK